MKAGWEQALLGDVCEILDSRRKPVTKKDRRPGDFPYYGATGIVDYVDEFIFDEPLVLVGEDGAKWGSGESTAFSVFGRCWVNNHAHVLRPTRAKLLDDWLVYYLVHEDLSPFVSGLTVPKLNQGSLRQIPILLPPLDEQQRIIAILDEAFEGLATAKANAEKNLKNARELFEGHLQSVFSNPGHGWQARALEELGTITSSKRIFKDEYVETGIPFYRTKEVKELANGLEITTELFITESRYNEIKSGFGVPKEGDILLTAIGTIGEIWVVDGKNDFYFKDGNVLWLKNFNSVNTQFLKYVLLSFVESLKKMSHGSAYSALPIQRLNAHQIFLPTLEEQAQIVNTLDELLDFSRQLETIYRQKLTALEELKKSLLHQAFSGQL